MVQFQNALLQYFFVNGRFAVDVELELRNERGNGKFCDRLVVGGSLDLGVLHHVGFRHGLGGGIEHVGSIVFIRFRCGRGRHALFDGDGCNQVADFVLIRHEPERQPDVHDLPAELF